jgi:hypothetical protein
MLQTPSTVPDLYIPGTRKLMSGRAPVESGRKRGYFKDDETRVLLSLNSDDFMLNSGTYGTKELGENPVDFAVLRHGTYDQRFLPFVPRSHGTWRLRYLEIRSTNMQWMPTSRALAGLRENFLELVEEARKVALQTNLPLPDYVYQLVPRLLYLDHDESKVFELQFQIWFELEAHYARWRRIERVIGLLAGYINACQLLLNPASKNWFCGDPIGIQFNPSNPDERDKGLVQAYAFLAIPVDCPEAWVIPDHYGLQDAQAALLSEGRGSKTDRLTFPSIEGLPGTDHDALMFSDVRPDYPEHRYMADGTKRSKQQRKHYDEGESSDMVDAEGSADEEIGNLPTVSSRVAEVMGDVQPTSEPALQSFELLRRALPAPPSPNQPSKSLPRDTESTLRLDTARSLAPPPSTSTPASASSSAPASAASSAFSSTSSRNASSHSRRESAPRRGRTSRMRQRAREYPGSSRQPPRAPASRDRWEQYFDSREARGTSYDNRGSAPRASSAALAPPTMVNEVGPVRAVPQLRVLDMQTQPMLLHDTASNQLVEAAILSTDFSQSSVLQRAIQQRQEPSRPFGRSRSRERNRSPSRQSGSRNRSRDRGREYSRRSPSPSYRRRSPPAPDRRPMERNYRGLSPPRHEQSRYSRRPSPARDRGWESIRGRRQEPPPEEQRPRHGIDSRSSNSYIYAPPIEEDSGHGWGSSSPSYHVNPPP